MSAFRDRIEEMQKRGKRGKGDKTTGGKGLHVQAPITPSEDWETVRTFCRAVAEAFVAHAPDRYTANMSKAKRTDKIYVDYVRNTRGSTSIAPYSTRAKEHATIGALVDPPATCINASGDTVASMIVARFVEGKDWFQKKQAERAEKAGA